MNVINNLRKNVNLTETRSENRGEGSRNGENFTKHIFYKELVHKEGYILHTHTEKVYVH